MIEFLKYLYAHPAIMLGAGWAFSAIVGAMPPLPDNATYLVRWAHDALQVLASNVTKVSIIAKK
jgi:hypothetical protein